MDDAPTAKPDKKALIQTVSCARGPMATMAFEHFAAAPFQMPKSSKR
jgi:hypothetical protein